jgi:hypothetical protein
MLIKDCCRVYIQGSEMIRSVVPKIDKLHEDHDDKKEGHEEFLEV